MARKLTRYVCRSCGHDEPKWLGQCPSCGEWNTLEERTIRQPAGSTSPTAARAAAARASGRSAAGPDGEVAEADRATLLSGVAAEHRARLSTGIGELDRALGGGLMRGATVLVGGEPGIGKSTLLLQMAGRMRGVGVLYVSAEESASQIRSRAERLGVAAASDHLYLMCSGDLDAVLAEIDRVQPTVVIVDSIQTLIAAEAGSVPGTVNQIKLITHELARWARAAEGCVIAVAHVTKEGQIAGPKVVEHMVDAVLLFEHSDGELRYLRATKNRFGAIEEVGLFTMGADGLAELRDPARAFLGDDRDERPAGVVAAPSWEGSRVLVVELQALTVPAKGSVSRTFSDRIDGRRVSRVAAVLEKHVGVRFGDQDLYVNVAGGLRVADVAIDLPLALALYSARTGLAVPRALLATGELSLAGEVRSVSQRDRRMRAAAELGFTSVVGPASLRPDEADGKRRGDDPTWIAARSVSEAIRAVFGSQRRNAGDD